MNIENIFKQAYLETNTSKNEYSYESALVVFNELYKQVWRKVVNQNQDFFWNYRTTDIQEGVTEYAIQRKNIEDQETGKLIPGISKVQKVFYYKDGAFKEELVELSEEQEKAGMIGYRVKDNHIILSFSPTADVADGLEIQGIQNINTLTLESEESDIFPGHEDLADFSEVLYLGLKEKLYRVKKDTLNIQQAKMEYQEALADMIRFISTRTSSIYTSELLY